MRYAVQNSLGRITWHTSGGKHAPRPAVFATRREAETLAETMRGLNRHMTQQPSPPTYDVVEVA